MSYSNYSQIEIAISNFQPFTGHSCRGYWDNGEYVVISYDTYIGRANRAVVAGATRNENVWVNPNKYSQTTSRLQNIIRRAWGLN